VGWCYVFVAVFVAWVFFRAQDVGQAMTVVKAMFAGAVQWQPTADVRQILALSLALMVLQLPVERLLQRLREARLQPAAAVAAGFWSVVAAVVLGAPAAVPFIYFQF
jgi:alginate O-acetyltransferase complex protein AlgI